MAEENNKPNPFDFNELSGKSKDELERIKLAREISDLDEKKKDEKKDEKKEAKTNFWQEKFVIPALLTILAVFLQLINTWQTRQDRIAEENRQHHYDTLVAQQKATNDAIAAKQKADYDMITAKQKAEYDLVSKQNDAKWREAEIRQQEIYKKSFESFSSALQLKNGLTLQEQDYINQLKRTFLNDSLAREYDKSKTNLEYISTQLSEFYCPLYYRLQKNNAVYKLMSNSFIGEKIDTSVVLKNHKEILDILENKYYLARPNDSLASAITQYIKNVSIYRVIRSGNYRAFPKNTFPQDFGAGYPDDLFKLVQERTFKLQYTYDSAVRTINPFVHFADSIRITQVDYKDAGRKNSSMLLDTIISIRDSWTKKSYYDKVDDNLRICLSSASLDKEYAHIIIEFKNNVSGKFEENDWKHVHLRKGDIGWFEKDLVNYQIELYNIYVIKEGHKDRSTALLRIKRWKD